jgi:uncharacterized protein YkwD
VGRSELRGLLIVVAVVAAGIWFAATRPSEPREPEPVRLPQASAADRCPGSRLPAERVASDAGRAAVLCLLNAERAARGRPALLEDARLQAAALAHAQDMAKRNYFAHESPEGTSPGQRAEAAGYRARSVGGENLAWGAREAATPSVAVRGWMESPGHRRLLLDPRFVAIGIGIVRGAAQAGVPEDEAAVFATSFGG